MKPEIILPLLGLAFLGTACHLRDLASLRNAAMSRLTPAASPTELAEGNWQASRSQCESTTCTLKVQILIQKSCYAGDMDVIEADIAKFSTDKSVLLSLEALAPNDKTPFAPVGERIPLEKLGKGDPITLTFPRMEKPIQLGLMLCKDAGNTKSCLKKKVIDVSKLLVRDYISASKMSNFQSPDTLFFFQYLLVDNQSLISFDDMSEKGFSEEIFSRRLKFIRSRSDVADNAIIDAGMKEGRRFAETLRSMPLGMSPGEVHVVLPKSDPNCHPTPRSTPTLK